MNNIKTRIIFIFIALLGLYSILAARLFYLQLIMHEFYTERSLEQRLRVIDLSPDRGDIFDRNGGLLATTVDSYSIFATPSNMTNKKDAAMLVAKALETDYGSVYEKLDSNKPFVWIKRKVDSSFKENIKKLNLAGIGILKEKKRIYPKGRLASQILGFVGIDNQGLANLELKYDSYLRGREGKLITEIDVRGRDILTSSLREIQTPSNGMNLTLTIDESIQYVAEKGIRNAVKKSKARSGVVIVMDVKTGEILALASYPDFDPNEYNRSKPENWYNRAITQSYEPGSTFKLVTIAAGLQENAITPKSPIYCADSVELGGRTIKNSHTIKFKTRYVLPEEILEQSINTGAVQVALKLGKKKFYQSIKKFGFGEPSGIDLPGESPGILRGESLWYPVDVGTISFGQGVAVTPIQLIKCLSSIANGGVLVRPHIVKKIESQNKSYIKIFATDKKGRSVSEKVANEVLEMSEVVVTKGTGKTAKIRNFRVGGKTGTAEKPKSGGGYYSDRYVPSFIGFVPASDPKISVIVVVDEPQTEYWGEVVAAPVFKEVTEFALRKLNIAPDSL